MPKRKKTTAPRRSNLMITNPDDTAELAEYGALGCETFDHDDDPPRRRSPDRGAAGDDRGTPGLDDTDDEDEASDDDDPSEDEFDDVHEVVTGGDLGALYRDPALLAALADLRQSDPAAFAEVNVTLRGLKNFKVRDFDAALAQHAAPGGGTAGPAAAPGESPAKLLIRLANAGVELFHTPNQVPFARVSVGGHHENHPVRGATFRQWLKGEYYNETGHTPAPETFRSALDVLELLAARGPTHTVFLRTAAVPDPEDPDRPTYYIDLCDGDWQAVKISTDGWEVVGEVPVRFRRNRGMHPLPTPARGGSLDELRAFVNINDDGDWLLYRAFLAAAVRPAGPHPILAITGEMGSAKSSTSQVTRRMVDPNSCPLRSLSKDERDLMIAASNSGMLAYDNLSHLPDWLSDGLCRIATGGGMATRQLYSDDEETLFDAVRPILLNGIEDLTGRGDLLDRSLLIDLAEIPPARRREEADFWRAFDAAHPRLLGALLDAVVGGLRALPGTALDGLPRMADFARWAEAVSRAAGAAPGAFLGAYARNRARAVEIALEGSPAVQAVIALMAERPAWDGTAQALLTTLEERTEASRRRKGWPGSPRGLVGALRRAAPGLRSLGVTVGSGRSTDRARARILTIRRDP